MAKYLHVFDQISPVFNGQIIQLINDELKYGENTIFITFDKNLYESYKKYGNIFYNSDLINYLNRNYDKFDYIFIHAMNFKTLNLLKLKKIVVKKIIWCVWGHDLKLCNEEKNILKYIKKTISIWLRKRILKNVYAVGMGFGYDVIKVKYIVGDNPRIFFLPYGYQKNTKKDYLKISRNKRESNGCKIMIGHSGFPFLNHIKIMEKIKRFKENDIIISIPLAYGDNDYINEVKNYAKKNFKKDKIEIIDTMMSDMEYMKYLSTVDIAIFDFEHQSALGNIWKLAYLGKKIFLNKNGILKMAFELEGLVYGDVTDLDIVNFNDLITLISEEDKEKLHNYGKRYIDEDNILNAWKKTFKILDNTIKNRYTAN